MKLLVAILNYRAVMKAPQSVQQLVDLALCLAKFLGRGISCFTFAGISHLGKHQSCWDGKIGLKRPHCLHFDVAMIIMFILCDQEVKSSASCHLSESYQASKPNCTMC